MYNVIYINQIWFTLDAKQMSSLKQKYSWTEFLCLYDINNEHIYFIFITNTRLNEYWAQSFIC